MSSTESLHSPKAVAARLGIAVRILGERCREFAHFLSPTAQAPSRETGGLGSRHFTDQDVAVLAVVQRERAARATVAEIQGRLDRGELRVDGVIATRLGGSMPEARMTAPVCEAHLALDGTGQPDPAIEQDVTALGAGAPALAAERVEPDAAVLRFIAAANVELATANLLLLKHLLADRP